MVHSHLRICAQIRMLSSAKADENARVTGISPSAPWPIPRIHTAIRRVSPFNMAAPLVDRVRTNL